MARQLLNASQSEPCFSDGLGLRFVRVLGTGETVEALRLRPELAAMRESIRDRMNRLASFRQASFVPVRDTAAVLHQSGCLEVISDHVPGIRLSEILDAARARRVLVSTNAAFHVVRGLLGALAVLAESRSLAHGAVGPERVLLASKGRLIVTDYVYGLALERLECNQRKLWQDFRIPVPSGARTPSFDARADLLQVGLIAVALLMGRPVEGDEFPLQVPNLAGTLSLVFEGNRRGQVERGVKAWLGRMLEFEGSRPFAGAREALTALEAALATQRQSAGQASPLRLLANSYALAMAGPDAGPILPGEPAGATAAIALGERPTLDGDFTREIQVESIAQPPKLFEAQDAGGEGARRRRRVGAARSAERQDTGEHLRVRGAFGAAVRGAVTRLVGVAAAGFLLPVRVCLSALRGAFSGAKYAVAAVVATLRAARAGGRSVLAGLGVGVVGAASGVRMLGRTFGRLATSTAGAVGLAVRGAGALARLSGRLAISGAGALGHAVRGAGAMVSSSVRGAGGVARLAGSLLDRAGGGAIRAAQSAWAALRRTGGFVAALVSATCSAAAGGIRTALSGAHVAGRSLGPRCGRAVVDAVGSTGRVAAAAAQGVVRAAGRVGGATLRAVGAALRAVTVRAVGIAGRAVGAALGAAGVAGRAVGAALGAAGVAGRAVGAALGAAGVAIRAVGTGIARMAAALRWSIGRVVAVAAAAIAAMARGVAALGRLVLRRVWPAGIATLSAGVRLTVTAARAARLGATRLNPHPELRLQLLASTLVLLVTVYGIQLVKAHWSDGVAVTAQLSNTLTTGIKRADPRDWWPAGQPRIGAAVPDGGGRRDRAAAGPSADSGALNVTSSPDGAEVLLDGELQGRAPLTLDGVPAGVHTVLVRGGAGAVRQVVRVRPGATVEIAINMYSGWLVVFAPIGLEVMENGRSIGTSETGRIRLSPGEHRLEIVNERIGFRESRTPEVRPGETVAINVALPPAMLEISAPPDTDVLIDGQLIGKTPTEPVPVAVGTREVTLRHPSMGEQRQTVTITYRAPNRILFRPPG